MIERIIEAYRHERDNCFGIPGRFLPFLIGGFIILWGISVLLENIYHISINVWAFFAIILGLTIIYRGLSRRK